MNDTGQEEKQFGKVRPLDAAERRVLGVLVEKAKTTPDQYPLSLLALVSGCNQKSNREPVMNLDEEAVGRALESLRTIGAAAELFGSGRVPRYRHHLRDWLGVEGPQAAILAELLLRGEQSEGDLRGRASRMEPIADLTILRNHLDALAARGLVVWLSPPGRGRMLTHGLLPPEKLEKVKAQLGLAMAAAAAAGPPADDDDRAPPPAPRAAIPTPAPQPGRVEQLTERVAHLEATVADLTARLAAVEKLLE
ncbi:MAG: DUF480 domain-containing protein [Planctomycetes bacterium]|nr:DUF480 domain-containing protein [Planctomycetota bacterium]